jgi:RND family efflux transporter MFP subunit
VANPNADLGALTVSRTGPVRSDIRLPRRWASRIVVPGVLLAGFTALVLWASWDLVTPPVPVRVVPVVVRTGAVESVGQELFKANGWVEPRPLPIDVPVQTEGMYRVREVLVNPGERVTAGQLLVRLDDTRAALDLEAAEKRHAKRLAAAKAARADAGKAEVAVTNAEAAVALVKVEGEADVNTFAAELARAETGVKAAELAITVEEDLVRSKAVTSDLKVRQARQALEVARADRDAAAARLGKARTGTEVRVKQAGLARAAAAADHASVLARAEEAAQEAADAEVAVRLARLELSRTRIEAPLDGVVMALNVRAGTVVGGKGTFPEHKDAIVTLYDPKRLQVRVEVPVGKFALVRPGQPAEVEVEDVLPGKRIPGTVLYDTHLANVARNSVPVKVALPDDPPPELRPEMIASVRFRALPEAGRPKAEATRRLAVPRRLLVTEGEQVRVWVVDPLAGRADLRAVELAPGEKDRPGETAEVVGGLNPTDKLIGTGREGLRPGQRVRVVGEDR